MLIPGEHLFLYSSEALVELLHRLGVEYVSFEKAIFKEYDMFAFASRMPITVYPDEQIIETLTRTGQQRILLAVLDLYQDAQKYQRQYLQADLDRRNRLDQVNELIELLAQAEKDRADRLSQIYALTHQLNETARLLKESDEDRAARLGVIESSRKKIDMYSRAVNTLRKRIDYRIYRRLGLVNDFETALRNEPAKTKPEVPVDIHQESVPPASTQKRTLKRVLVDLTPIRPGGENGGAKPLTLELVKRISRDIAPGVEFILLTSSNSHDELAWLDSSNVSRLCVNQVNPAKSAAASSSPHPLEKPRTGWRRVTLRIGQLLESILPAPTFRRIYSLYHKEVKAPQATNLVRSLQADLVFCPFTGLFYYAPEVPVVAIVYDLQYLFYPEFFSPEERYHSDKNLRQICKAATRIICISEYTRKTVLERVEIDPDKIITIPTSLFNPLKPQPPEKVAAVLADYGLSAGNYLLFPANFWQHKNHTMLLTAFNLFCRRHPESSLHLVLTGAPSPRMQLLKQAVQQMQIADRVIFAGYVSSETLAALYQGCLAIIFPSLFEGFGAPILEGMLFKKPVLSSNMTSLPEVGGEAVLYFDPRRPEEIVSSIERIINEPGLAEELSRLGEQQASLFTAPGRWAQHYFDLFQEAFSSEHVYENMLSGVYLDGWAGSQLEVSIASDRRNRRLELELNAPPWFPRKELAMRFQGGPMQQPQTFILPRGETCNFSIPLNAQSGIIEVILQPTTSPQEAGINNDTRQITCIVKSCQIILDDQVIDLFHH